MELFNITVTPQLFEEILTEEVSLICVEGILKINEIFRITEDSDLNRSLFARVDEQKQFQRTAKTKKLFFWAKGEDTYTSVIKFELTAMMEIDGRNVPMILSKNLDEIVKDVTVNKEVDLKDLPAIHCTDNNAVLLNTLQFKSAVLGRTNNIVNLTVECAESDGNTFKYDLVLSNAL